MKHLRESDFVALAAGFGDQRQRGHLEACTACRDHAAEMASVVRMAAGMELPQPRRGLADRVVANLHAAPRRSRALPWRAWAVAAAAGIVLAAIVVQRHATIPQVAAPAPVANRADGIGTRESAPDNRITLLAVADHLDRSQALLTALSHSDSPSPRLQAWAADLLASNRLIEQSARADGDTASAQLLAEMEPTLLQLAHFSDDAPPPQWHALKQRVASSGILFKVQVVDETLQNELILHPQSKNLESTL
ncbi:MAG TPA: hypothetical protein VN690_11135 [Terriglobales bacterium]|nr:hypothetical protein [Terriglobales bacterium]